MIFALATVLAAMSSAEAIVTVLNSASATGPRTFAEAREVVMRDAEAGKPLQQFVIGVTSDDQSLSARYLEASRPKIRAMAETRDNPLAWYLLSMESNDLKMLRRAADGGNVQALNALGSIVVSQAVNTKGLATNDVRKILRKGFGYFGQAAAQHDANGFINLGTCYLRGFGCKGDLTLAFECFRSAAELGHPEGMDYMSACYENGHGVAPDAERSLYWRMRGRAVRGDAAAAKWLKERK